MPQKRILTNRQGFKKEISKPRFAVPAGACDSHMHILGPYSRFALKNTVSLSPVEAPVEAYRAMRKTLGLSRAVIVQPSSYGKDNACTLNALQTLGDTARAVVVIDPDISEESLAAMHAAGVRGVRFQSVVSGGASFEEMEKIASLIRPFGWHLQIFMDAGHLPDMAQRIGRLPVDVVFDHMAHVIDGASTASEGFNHLLDLLQNGKTWVKLCSAFFPAERQRAQLLLSHAPQRLVWGTDWPHLSYQVDAPDDGQLVDELHAWCEDEKLTGQVLVDNPGQLYFSQSR